MFLWLQLCHLQPSLMDPERQSASFQPISTKTPAQSPRSATSR